MATTESTGRSEFRQAQAQVEGREEFAEGAGGEEIFDEKERVRIRKTGGVEFASPLSQAELEARHVEYSAQIDHQKLIIARAREESLAASRQANEQEILAREALEFKEFNKRRHAESAQEARMLQSEVNALIERERELEHERATAHHAAVEKERERVRAKTSEVIAREECIEAEKRELYHKELIRKCQSMILKYKLEEEQAKLKLESLQYSIQHGEFRATAGASKAKIIVEVEPRDLPEARTFDTVQLEPNIASAEMAEEGVPTMAETRTIEEIVTSERSSGLVSSSAKKFRDSGLPSTGTSTYSAVRGGQKSDESLAQREEFLASSASSGLAPSTTTITSITTSATGPSAPSLPPPAPSSGDFKVLPDFKGPLPSAEPGGVVYGGGSAAQSNLGMAQQSAQQLGQQAQASGQAFQSAGESSAQQFAPGAQGSNLPSQAQQPTGTGGGGDAGAGGVEGKGQPAAKKEKSGGLFKRFQKSKQSHEGH
jgi:hypothetical protein